MSAWSQSSQPSARPASSDSPTAAARPLAKTLRTSLRADASPTSGPTGVTGMPSAPKALREALGPGPDTSAGVRKSAARHRAEQRHVRERRAAAGHRRRRRRLTAGAAVLRSAKSASGVEPGGRALCYVHGHRGRVEAQHDLCSARGVGLARGRLYAVGRVAHGVPAAHRRAGRHEIGGDGAARLAKPDHGDDAGSAHPAVLASTAGDCSGRTMRSTSRR